MRRLAITRRVLLVASFFCGCATYHPEPLEPAKVVQQFESRSLSNAGLHEYLEANLGAKFSAYPRREWGLASLTLVGFYYNPDLAVAAARVREADAAIITAGAMPNPTVHIGPVYREAASPNFAPWGIGSFTLELPIETAGKRGYRMAAAERLADAARLAAGETAWTVRSRIRAALLQLLLDVRGRDLAAKEEEALSQIAILFTHRVSAGAASQPELSLALSFLQGAKLKTTQAGARVSEDRNALSVVLGLPVEALDGARFSWPTLDSPPSDESLSPRAIQGLALLNRIDLRRELAEYSAADETLKLEIAKQYPDINIAGGYSWEGGENFFELGPSAVLPVFNKNQGPVAEAEARRKRIAAEFHKSQSGIINQSKAALARYREALNVLKTARDAAVYQSRRLQQAGRAVAVGESDAVLLAQTQLQNLTAQESVLESLTNAQTALGALEDSIQHPLDSRDIGTFTFPARQRDSRKAATKQ